MTAKEDVLELRRKFNWTQTQTARKLGVRERTIRRWERGETKISRPISHLIKFLLDQGEEE